MDVWELKETLKPYPLRKGTALWAYPVVGAFLGWRREAEFPECTVISGVPQGSDCSHCVRGRGPERAGTFSPGECMRTWNSVFPTKAQAGWLTLMSLAATSSCLSPPNNRKSLHASISLPAQETGSCVSLFSLPLLARTPAMALAHEPHLSPSGGQLWEMSLGNSLVKDGIGLG